MHDTYYGDKTVPPVKQITGQFNCKQMTDEQLSGYLLRVRGIYLKIIEKK